MTPAVKAPINSLDEHCWSNDSTLTLIMTGTCHEASAQAEVLWHQEYRKEVDVTEQKPDRRQ